MTGYAVVDLETTGLFPSMHDRVVEIAVVHVAPDGGIESSWSTLVNPGRDLGPQHIHGIRAADVLNAPSFREIAGEVVALLDGRTFVAHNADFDRRFLHAEFATAGWDVPLTPERCLCTMRWASRLLPGAPRALAGCCAHLGIPLLDAHSALADATAAAHLLCTYLERHRPAPWHDLLERSALAPWPNVPRGHFRIAQRGAASAQDIPFLERLAAELPQSGGAWEHEQYLALLDRALLDRFLSVREQEALVAYAAELGIDRTTAHALHVTYFEALARLAWADGVLTDEERRDLDAVAALLNVGHADTSAAEPSSHGMSEASKLEGPTHTVPRFTLAPGDLIVFTGDMALPRDAWIARAEAAGLVPWPNVTKKVALVVAADPDSLSGKARKAAGYGIPIVTEHAFEQMLTTLSR